MIVDASAVLAILKKETNALVIAKALEASALSRISAANWLEASIVVDSRRDPVASRRFDEFVEQAKLVIEPVTESQAIIARAAYRDFGKGSGHPAQLNYGDCFAYALAKTLGEPLLFTGSDFTHTDIKNAI
jgi:ribonuclease VapC